MHMTKYKPLLLRFVIAGTAGITVALIAAVAVWLNIDSQMNVSSNKWSTQRTLWSLGEALHDYQNKNKSLPETLGDLRRLDTYHVWFDREQDLLDGWQRPFEYTTDGTNYTVTSYGRDGERGGVGLDCDLTDITAYSAPSAPTFAQLLFDCYPGIVGTCALSGLLTFVLSWLIARPTELTREKFIFLGARVAMTVIGAIIVGFFLALFHIPTGH
jgi:hypothetical protein